MEIFKVRAFTQEDGTGGNMAGVVLDSGGMSGAEKQGLAKELGYSETAFLDRRAGEPDELEFYTPTKQIAICGHATVATYGVLAGSLPQGTHQVKIAGEMLQVKIVEGKVGLQQKLSFVRDLPNFKEILAKAFEGIRPEAILKTSWVNNGVSFFVIEIAGWDQLKYLKPVQEEISKISQDHDLVGFYLFANSNTSTFYTRMFAPAYGIPEESATGMGAGCMMAHLYKDKKLEQMHVVQGLGMNPPQPSVIDVETTGKEIWVYGSYTIEKV